MILYVGYGRNEGHMKKVKNFIKKHKLKFLLGILVLFLICGLIYAKPYLDYYCRDKVTNETLDKLKLDGITKLMIVAHPDDETLWGGGTLIANDYLVVCLTNGNNKERSEEFMNVMKATNDIGLILSYPDKIHGKRSDWDFCKSGIIDDIETIINYKKWTTIVTHNEAGEYGHFHHIMTNSFVTEVCNTLDYKGFLMYFGRYYKVKDIEVLGKDGLLPKPLSDEILNKKMALLSLYSSQSKTVEHLGHMIPYENISFNPY